MHPRADAAVPLRPRLGSARRTRPGWLRENDLGACRVAVSPGLCANLRTAEREVAGGLIEASKIAAGEEPSEAADTQYVHMSFP